jgi:predicted dithiol-disulfide oxidoreductase (DUF899 family)
MSNLENPLTMEYPKIVSRAKWLNARKKLLAKEKELTRHRDAVNAERRRLPMVRIEKDYFFDGPAGNVRLLDLFENRRAQWCAKSIDSVRKGEGHDGKE